MAAASKKKASKKTGKKVARKTAKKAAKKASKKTVTAKKKVSARSKKTVAKKSTKKVTKRPARTTAKSTKKSKVSKKSARSTAPGKKRGGKSGVPGVSRYKTRKGERYMNDAQLDHFRSILDTLRTQLVSDINRTIHTMQDETINHPDPNDRATQETDMSLELRNRDRERKLIKKIDETLARINEDDYGFCEKCGIEIGVARLEARPTATLCVDCKTLDEIRERQLI